MPCIPTRGRPLVLRGTLTTFRRRCGKASCRCATGAGHESPALTYTEAGRTKTLTLRAAEVAEVAEALARYETAKADLKAATSSGIAELRARRAGKDTAR
jgi:Family of unknown function (DUF6788)